MEGEEIWLVWVACLCIRLIKHPSRYHLYTYTRTHKEKRKRQIIIPCVAKMPANLSQVCDNSLKSKDRTEFQIIIACGLPVIEMSSRVKDEEEKDGKASDYLGICLTNLTRSFDQKCPHLSKFQKDYEDKKKAVRLLLHM